MPAWVGYLIVTIIVMVAAYIFAPTPKMENAKKAGLDDFSFPTNSSARCIPEVFGTVEIHGNVIYAGGLTTSEIRQAGGGKSGSYTVGYAYFLDLAYALCSKIDIFISFCIDGTPVTSPEYLTSGQEFSAKTGESAAVGGSGNRTSRIRVYFGTQTTADARMSAMSGAQIAYRNVAYIVMPQIFIGDNVRTAPNYSAIVKRTNLLQGWNYSDINGDANPAHVIYYILTQHAKMPPEMLDAASFQSAGHALFQEELGISMTMSGEHEAREWCEEILRTIDAVWTIDNVTGKIGLKLLRDDYDLNLIPEVTDTHTNNVSIERKSWEDVASRIVLKYTDRATFSEASVTGLNEAAKLATGYEKSQTIEYMGITNVKAANMVMSRLFQKLSYPLATVKFSISSMDFPSIKIGDVLRFSSTFFGVQNMAVRIIALGADKEDEQIVDVECVEDVFALGNMVITGNQPNEGIPTDLSIGEILYYDIKNAKQEMSTVRAVIPLVAYPAGFVQSVEAKDGLSGQAIEAANSLLGTLKENYNPNMVLDSAIDMGEGFVVTPVTDMWNIAGTYEAWTRLKYVAYIGDEQIGYRYRLLQADGTYIIREIIRGLNNTPISAHTAGERVWFATVDGNDMPILTIISPNPTITLTPKNFSLIGESVSLGHNYDYSVETPYPPANLKAIRNGNEITITWHPCKRLAGANYRNADNILCGEDEGEFEGRWIVAWSGGEAIVTEPKFTRTDATVREYGIKSIFGAHVSAAVKITA
jgi:hypothetical protein